ncbi:MAG: hypothetical protein ACKVW3_16125 [Phycisphaerales bacterium]
MKARFLLALATAAVFAGCKSDGGSSDAPKAPQTPGVMNVPMAYTPKGKVNVPPMPTAPSLRLFVADTIDKRDTGERIGEIHDDGRTVTAIGVGDSPATIVRTAFTTELPRFGFALVGDASQANRVLTVTLQRFYCTADGNTWKSVSEGTVEVRDAGGAVLWNAFVTADGGNWGNNENPENAREVLCNAAQEMVERCLKVEAFVNALKVN